MGWPGSSFLGVGEGAAEEEEDRREPKLEARPPRVEDLRFTLVLVVGVGVVGAAAGFDLDGVELLHVPAADFSSLSSLHVSFLHVSSSSSYLGRVHRRAKSNRSASQRKSFAVLAPVLVFAPFLASFVATFVPAAAAALLASLLPRDIPETPLVRLLALVVLVLFVLLEPFISPLPLLLDMSSFDLLLLLLLFVSAEPLLLLMVLPPPPTALATGTDTPQRAKAVSRRQPDEWTGVRGCGCWSDA